MRKLFSLMIAGALTASMFGCGGSREVRIEAPNEEDMTPEQRQMQEQMRQQMQRQMQQMQQMQQQMQPQQQPQQER